jgi:thiol:disulfide interchange protein
MKFIATMLLATLPLTAQYSVKWEHDYKAALVRAKAEKKPIFMDLWTEWCPPCQFLKSKVFPTPEAQAALASFVPLSALVQHKDRTPVPEGTELAERFKLEAFPTLLILDENGRELRRQVGAFSSGAELAQWLNRKQ